MARVTWGDVGRFLKSRPFAAKAKRVARAAYAGAAFSRLTADWITTPLSADSEVRWDLRILRSRARELVRNTAYGRRFAFLVANNVAGPQGIRYYARVKNREGDLWESVNQKLEAAWYQWWESADVSVDGLLTGPDLEQLLCRALPADGEVLIRIYETDANPFGLALQYLDPDLLDHQMNERAANGNEIRMGVERDQFGKPLRYHLFVRHPNDPYFQQSRQARIAVLAEDIIHRYRLDRPGQTRGISWFAPVMADLNMLRGYQEAELVAARCAAAKVGFIVPSPDAPAIDPNLNPLNPPQFDASPGTIDRLEPGEEFKSWDPTHPSGNFGNFAKVILQSIAVGLGASYHSLTGDMSQSNFSSSRMSELEARDQWRSLQRWLIAGFHERVFRRWLRVAQLRGAIGLPDRAMERWLEHEWAPRGWGFINPKDEIEAAVYAIQNGLQSRTRELANEGLEFEDIAGDLKKEREAAEKYGIQITSAPSPKSLNEPPPKEPTQAEGGEGPDTGQGGGGMDRALTVMQDTAAAIERSTGEVAGAVKWIAGRDQPPPVINVTTPDVHVDVAAPVVHVAPQPLAVTIEAAKTGARSVTFKDGSGTVVRTAELSEAAA